MELSWKCTLYDAGTASWSHASFFWPHLGSNDIDTRWRVNAAGRKPYWKNNRFSQTNRFKGQFVSIENLSLWLAVERYQNYLVCVPSFVFELHNFEIEIFHLDQPHSIGRGFRAQSRGDHFAAFVVAVMFSSDSDTVLIAGTTSRLTLPVLLDFTSAGVGTEAIPATPAMYRRSPVLQIAKKRSSSSSSRQVL